jgi:hypothetical protein
MTITASMQLLDANIHGVSDMTAHRSGSTTWLQLRTSKGETVNVFMDHDMASEIADLWQAMNREPEPSTFDEALAAKFGREALNDEAMRVKGMLK